MLSLDQDLAADLRAKDGLVADAENQLQVQAFAVPDVAATVFRRFSQCGMGQLQNALRRAALSSETVDTLITEFEGQVFEPGDDLSRWFDCRDREGTTGSCVGSSRCGSSGGPSQRCCLTTATTKRR